MSNCQENIPSMNLEPSPSASNSHDFAMNTQAADVQACLKVVHEALEDVKAKDILAIDVSLISNVADAIVIASLRKSFQTILDSSKVPDRRTGCVPNLFQIQNALVPNKI